MLMTTTTTTTTTTTVTMMMKSMTTKTMMISRRFERAAARDRVRRRAIRAPMPPTAECRPPALGGARMQTAAMRRTVLKMLQIKMQIKEQLQTTLARTRTRPLMSAPIACRHSKWSKQSTATEAAFRAQIEHGAQRVVESERRGRGRGCLGGIGGIRWIRRVGGIGRRRRERQNGQFAEQRRGLVENIVDDGRVCVPKNANNCKTQTEPVKFNAIQNMN